MAISFFKLPKHKQFNYIPRYYDERKEELNERIKQIELEMGVRNPDKNYVPKIKGQIRNQYYRNIKERKQSNLRLIIILIALFLIAYLIFFQQAIF